MRTVEVTNCMILEGLLNRPGQLPYAWKPRLLKTTSTVLLLGSNVLHMVVHHDIRTVDEGVGLGVESLSLHP